MTESGFGQELTAVRIHARGRDDDEALGIAEFADEFRRVLDTADWRSQEDPLDEDLALLHVSTDPSDVTEPDRIVPEVISDVVVSIGLFIGSAATQWTLTKVFDQVWARARKAFTKLRKRSRGQIQASTHFEGNRITAVALVDTGSSVDAVLESIKKTLFHVQELVETQHLEATTVVCRFDADGVLMETTIHSVKGGRPGRLSG